jgi:cellulose synthase/poly-beta-1,6-N-acetylglucosamine synthase-like glycosyltransferase
MDSIRTIFWVCAALVVYTYLGYPFLLILAAKLRPRPVRRGSSGPRTVSIILVVHNEAAIIERRLDELTVLLESSGLDGEILVVSDGSTDDTAELARRHAGRRVRVLELADNQGKAAALSQGCAAARHDIIVFADARQTWAPDALPLLVDNFADPEVGAVSGDLVLQADGLLDGVGLYWQLEKWLRRKESQVGSLVGVSGSIAAVRRELFRPIPPWTMLDDVYWPMQVALQHRRVVHDARAHAYDRLPLRTRDEFRRKVRTLSGNLQLTALLPALLLPWRNPLWVQFVSHKLLRLVVPWALLALLPLSWWLPDRVYQVLFWGQLGAYGLALAGLAGLRWRPAAAAAAFVVLNSASWVAGWVWVIGRAGASWKKVSYEPGWVAGGGWRVASDKVTN